MTARTKRIIKFKRAFFKDTECTEFSHFRDWGLGVDDSSFVSPSSNNTAPYFIDLQYFEANEKEFCEGDIFQDIANIWVTVFSNGGLILRSIIVEGRWTGIYLIEKFNKYINHIGNIYEDTELLNPELYTELFVKKISDVNIQY